MRVGQKISWVLAGLLVLSVAVMFMQRAEASGDRDNDCNGHGNCNDIEIVEGGDGGNSRGGDGGDATGGEGGSGGEGGAGGDATAETGPITVDGTGGAGGSGGGATVSTKSENSTIVLGAARDTADCFTKVQLGAEGFGIGFSRSDAFCKKVRLVARKIDEGNFAAAARLECTLPQWEEVYGHKKPRDKKGNMTPGYALCIDDLMPVEAVPVPTGSMLLPVDEYDELLAQAASAEEVEEFVEQAEYRYSQQANMIDALEAAQAEKDRELERLKRDAAELKAAQKADEERVETRQEALTALYEKRVAKDQEPDDNE